MSAATYFLVPEEKIPRLPSGRPGFGSRHGWHMALGLTLLALGGGLWLYAQFGQAGTAVPQPGPRRFPPAYHHASVSALPPPNTALRS